jgi:putative FmdB family regulatory protein
MPLYEYRCRDCETTFEVRRPMSDAALSTTCPSGHPGAVRLLSVFASVSSGGAGSSGAASSMPPPAPRSAGPCGSACGCHH